jgi:membrane-associated phospholipid phosphatase
MTAPAGGGESANYFLQLLALTRRSAAQLARPPSHSRRAEAARRLARRVLVTTAIVSAIIVALMLWFDAREIDLMPQRRSAGLWPARTLTDFGKETYVLSALAATLFVVALVAAALQGRSLARWLAIATRLQFLFCAVLLPVAAGEVIKWIVGRGRPFVGGKADAFNFVPFAGTEAYFSFPSAHAITAFALAFAVGAVWPRARIAIFGYAVLIAATRLVLLAHHPSDVVGGALIGVVGAMCMRYWFAARRLGFAIHRDGEIVPLRSLSGRLKRVARGPSSP